VKRAHCRPRSCSLILCSHTAPGPPSLSFVLCLLAHVQ
jgi:hypothetical protein